MDRENRSEKNRFLDLVLVGSDLKKSIVLSVPQTILQSEIKEIFFVISICLL